MSCPTRIWSGQGIDAELAVEAGLPGGVLNVVRHELELVCDASDIPSEVTISLKGLEVGDSLHISAVTLPKGTTSAIDDRDFTIATVVAPSALKSSEGDTSTEATEEAAGE